MTLATLHSARFVFLGLLLLFVALAVFVSRRRT